MRTVFGRDYLFQKPYWAWIQGLIDSMGYLVFRPARVGQGAVPENVKKILVSRIDHLGDVFIACSILPHLKKAYPGASIHFMAGDWARDYLGSNPDIDKVLVYNAAKLARSGGLIRKIFGEATSFITNIREMRSESYDLCIDMRAYPVNSIPLLYLGGGKFNTGFTTGGFGFLLDKAAPYRPGVHETFHIRDILEVLGIKVLDAIKPEFQIQEKLLKEAETMLSGLGLKPGEPYVLIHTGAGARIKLWKKERWQEVIDSIRREFGLTPVVYDNVYGDLRDCIKLPGLLSFEGFAAVIKKARLFIGLDSLPGHLAASLFTPVIAIWCGVNDHNQWRPVGGQVSIIRKSLPCAPCFRKNGCAAMDCMDIGAEACVREMRKYLEPGHSSTAQSRML